MNVLSKQEPVIRRRKNRFVFKDRKKLLFAIIILGAFAAVFVGYKIFYSENRVFSGVPKNMKILVEDIFSVEIKCGKDAISIKILKDGLPGNNENSASEMKMTIDGLKRLADALGGILINIPEKIDYKGEDNLTVRIESGMRRLDADRAESYFKRPNSSPTASIRAILLGVALRASEIRAENVDIESLLSAALEPGARGKDGKNSRRLAAILNYAATLGPSDIGIEWKIAPRIESTAASEEQQTKLPIKIRILNGVGKPGLAARIAAKFGAPHFEIVETANADRFGYKQTVIRTANSSAGAELKEILGLGNIESSNNIRGADIELIIGKDLNR